VRKELTQKKRNYTNCFSCNNFILLWRKIKIE